jgi:hypothetical protein
MSDHPANVEEDAMAKRKSTPKKKASSLPSATRKKKAVKKTPVKKKRRSRSRGAKRNKKTAGVHAANKLESIATGEPQSSEVQPPEDYAPGPSVSILDGSENINRERQVIEAMLDHPEWVVPPLAYTHLPHKLTRIGLNMGDLKDDEGNVIRENVEEQGNWSTNQQLTAITMLCRMTEANLRKLQALKPSEVRVLNEQPTIVTVEDQRVAVLAAIAAEVRRRQSGGAISHRPDGDLDWHPAAGRVSTNGDGEDQDEG